MSIRAEEASNTGVAFWAPRDHGGDWAGTVSIAM